MANSQEPRKPPLSGDAYKAWCVRQRQEAINRAVAFAKHFGIDKAPPLREAIDRYLFLTYGAPRPGASKADKTAARKRFLDRIRTVCADPTLMAVNGATPFEVHCDAFEGTWSIENIARNAQRHKPAQKVASQAQTSRLQQSRLTKAIDGHTNPRARMDAELNEKLLDFVCKQMQQMADFASTAVPKNVLPPSGGTGG